MAKAETCQVPGVEGQFPTHTADGKEILYYCPHCQEQPSAGPGQLAVGMNHDECTWARFEVIYPQLIRAQAEGLERILAILK